MCTIGSYKLCTTNRTKKQLCFIDGFFFIKCKMNLNIIWDIMFNLRRSGCRCTNGFWNAVIRRCCIDSFFLSFLMRYYSQVLLFTYVPNEWPFQIGGVFAGNCQLFISFGARRLLASHELYGANCYLVDTSGLKWKLICWSFRVYFFRQFLWSYG